MCKFDEPWQKYHVENQWMKRVFVDKMMSY